MPKLLGYLLLLSQKYQQGSWIGPLVAGTPPTWSQCQPILIFFVFFERQKQVIHPLIHSLRGHNTKAGSGAENSIQISPFGPLPAVSREAELETGSGAWIKHSDTADLNLAAEHVLCGQDDLTCRLLFVDETTQYQCHSWRFDFCISNYILALL